mgnify:CR=1
MCADVVRVVCELFHQHYSKSVGFFGSELGDAAETSSFQVSFGDSTAHQLLTNVLGSFYT